MILLGAPALCAVIGFAVGHYTASPEPFYYIGTPVESSASHIAPSSNDNAAHSSNTSQSGTRREQLVISSAAAEGICGARTKSGKPCQRKVKGGGYCWQHREKLTRKDSTGPTQ